jgi:hypothetical protein
MVKPFFAAFEKIEMPRKKIDLIIFDNTDNQQLHAALSHELKSIKDNFASAKLHISGRQGGRTILGQDNDVWKTSKLSPIWQMWLDMIKMIDTDIFFVLEDDTIAPPHAFMELVGQLISRERCAFVTGIETGRAQFSWQKVRLGVHYLTREKNLVVRRVSLHPDTQGVVSIDAAGVYCFAARTEPYKKAFEGMGDYVASLPFFAMDNILTNNIKLAGWELYADFDVWCEHLQQGSGNLVYFGKKQAVQMADVWMPEYNNYAQGIEIKNT